jgi:VWFA-related protein
MKPQRLAGFLGALLSAALLIAPTIHAQTASAGGNVTFTVTASGKKDADVSNISKDDVQLLQGKERKQISDWKKGDALFLAILIDDSIENTAGGQWDYLREFIMAQSPATSIMVGYITNNGTRVAQDFTPNHELAAKALRIPMGVAALGSSPYLGTNDLLKRWPETGPRRSVVLITSGIDFFRGAGWGMFYPDLDPLISRAERQNTNIWTIYYPSASHRGHSFGLSNTAQNNLDKLSVSTGGESYFLGTGTPVSIKPYLDEIANHLNNQYMLSFAGTGGAKGKFQNVKVKTELKDVEFFTPAAVFIPPSSN